MVVDVYQQKTKKTVTPAITSEHIENYINNEFPYKISIQKFNDYLKDLCKECEINEPTKGKIYDKESKRKKLDTYPKFKLVSSHICRRTMATLNYKMFPTAMIMEITGHSKEGMFLEYIGKPKDKDANTKAYLRIVKENKNNQEQILKAV